MAGTAARRTKTFWTAVMMAFFLVFSVTALAVWPGLAMVTAERRHCTNRAHALVAMMGMHTLRTARAAATGRTLEAGELAAAMMRPAGPTAALLTATLLAAALTMVMMAPAGGSMMMTVLAAMEAGRAAPTAAHSTAMHSTAMHSTTGHSATACTATVRSAVLTVGTHAAVTTMLTVVAGLMAHTAA